LINGLPHLAAAVTLFSWLIFAAWLTLVGYWAISAVAMKRSTGRRWIWWREIALRLGFFAVVVMGLRVAVPGGALPNPLNAVDGSMLPGLIGCTLCTLGIGLAIRGRSLLNPIWGMPTSGLDSAALVTSGPYAYVRHPIYGGMLLAILGSAMGQSLFWLLPLLVYGPQLVLSARREETFLLQRFPERYRDYMKRTRMLLPFVL
jgi:protein-S-isoprenylcysteine O-methyltransferase Ste14